MVSAIALGCVGKSEFHGVRDARESIATIHRRVKKTFSNVEVAPDKTPYDRQKFKDVLALVKGRHVQFCLLVGGVKPSDPSGDPHAVEVLREMSDLALESGSHRHQSQQPHESIK